MTNNPSIAEGLVKIGDLNPHLADELAKLPEIRDSQSKSSRLALYTLLRIYRYAPARFDRMFACMDAIGLPARRNYCSPLQALFWMVQDDLLEASGMLLGLDIVKTPGSKGDLRINIRPATGKEVKGDASTGTEPAYTLKKVLDAAWNGETMLILGSMIRKIIQRLPASVEAEEYALLAERHSDRQLQSYIMDDFLRKKEMFNQKDRDTIERALKRSRWKLFDTVADRLNSPELINFYINRYFAFRKNPTDGVYFTFFKKTAQCTDAAYFAQFMLRRAGYQTFLRSVKWDENPWDGLHTGSGIILDDGRYLLVANFTGINSIAGPFDNTGSLDRQLSCNRKVIDSRWGAYFPPRHF
jgi:hypothetical protein